MNSLCALVLSGALVSVLCDAALANSNDCFKSSDVNARSEQIVAAALNEYAIFNGHRIDANGRLWKFGSTETENELLLDPETGLPAASGGARLAWRRVWEYWLVLDQHVPGIALSRKVVAFRGALADKAEDVKSTEKTLRELFFLLDQYPADGKEILSQAAVRAALSDSPWSAAFISYVMHRAGLNNAHFATLRRIGSM